MTKNKINLEETNVDLKIKVNLESLKISVAENLFVDDKVIKAKNELIRQLEEMKLKRIKRLLIKKYGKELLK